MIGSPSSGAAGEAPELLEDCSSVRALVSTPPLDLVPVDGLGFGNEDGLIEALASAEVEATGEAIANAVGGGEDPEHLASGGLLVRDDFRIRANAQGPGNELDEEVRAIWVLEVTATAVEPKLRHARFDIFSEQLSADEVKIARLVGTVRVHRDNRPADKDDPEAMGFKMPSHMPPELVLRAVGIVEVAH